MDRKLLVGVLGMIVFAVALLYYTWYYIREDAKERGMKTFQGSWLSFFSKEEDSLRFYLRHRKHCLPTTGSDPSECERYRNLMVVFMAGIFICSMSLILTLFK